MSLLSMILAPSFVALIAAHRIVAGVIAWAIFSAAVDGMPAPTENSGTAYKWLHASLNLLAGNLIRAISVLFPQTAALFPRITASLQRPQNEA